MRALVRVVPRLFPPPNAGWQTCSACVPQCPRVTSTRFPSPRVCSPPCSPPCSRVCERTCSRVCERTCSQACSQLCEGPPAVHVLFAFVSRARASPDVRELSELQNSDFPLIKQRSVLTLHIRVDSFSSSCWPDFLQFDHDRADSGALGHARAAARRQQGIGAGA